jgi:hypothetical protein
MVVRDAVQAGIPYRVSLLVETSPAESGKAGAFSLLEATLKVGAGSHDLVIDGWTVPDMVEVASSVAGTASVTSDPTYVGGGGPSLENVYDIPVDDSSPFSAGDFIRAQSAAQSIVYEVLEVPDGTTLRVHAKSTGFGIEDGDTVEKVSATGIYAGELSLDVDDYFTVGNPNGELRIVMATVAESADPGFSTAAENVWVFALALDVSGRPFRVG